MPNYRILFPTVGKYKKGDVVSAGMVAGDQQGVNYLLGPNIQAIEETEDEIAVYSQQDQAQLLVNDLRTQLEAVTAERDALKAELAKVTPAKQEDAAKK